MPTPFVELFGEVDTESLEEEVRETLEAAFEGWEPSDPNLDWWLTKIFVRITASVFGLASVVSREVFKTFGETIVSVPPILAAPATAQSTWKLIDDKGHTIEDGTIVSIEASGDETLSFRVVGDVVVAPESDETEAGEVLLEAVEPGTDYNELTAAPEPQSAVSFVESIALGGATANGVDAEDEDTYLSRLTEELQTLTLSAVIPRDYEILSRRIAGVARATALDNYHLESEESEQPLVITVFVVDEDGAALSEKVKDEVQALLEERSLSNIVTFVGDPSFTEVGAKVEIVVAPGYDPEAVIAAVEERLDAYLAAKNWGLPETGDAGTSSTWVNQTSVYVNEILSECDRVQGVSRVVSVELSKGEGELGTEDIELSGPAPLAEPGTLEVLAA
jgi:hypothetical protein